MRLTIKTETASVVDESETQDNDEGVGALTVQKFE